MQNSQDPLTAADFSKACKLYEVYCEVNNLVHEQPSAYVSDRAEDIVNLRNRNGLLAQVDIKGGYVLGQAFDTAEQPLWGEPGLQKIYLEGHHQNCLEGAKALDCITMEERSRDAALWLSTAPEHIGLEIIIAVAMQRLYVATEGFLAVQAEQASDPLVARIANAATLRQLRDLFRGFESSSKGHLSQINLELELALSGEEIVAPECIDASPLES